jgi:hypothetical protein
MLYASLRIHVKVYIKSLMLENTRAHMLVLGRKVTHNATVVDSIRVLCGFRKTHTHVRMHPTQTWHLLRRKK